MEKAIIFQWLLSMAGILKNASASLPLIISLGLIAGRRRESDFCIAANSWLATFSCLIAFISLFYFPALLLSGIYAISSIETHISEAILSMAGLPYSSSAFAWFCGFIFLCLARQKILHISLPHKPYALALIKKALLWLILAALCFFATFWLSNWPFAGLPAGLDMDKAIMAIARNAARQYFTAFCPAGALCLLCLDYSPVKNIFKTPEQLRMSIRWLALWSAAGYFPSTLQSLGILTGVGIRGNMQGAVGYLMAPQIFGVSSLLIAMVCWIMIFAKPLKLFWLRWLAFIMLLLYVSAPILGKLFIN